MRFAFFFLLLGLQCGCQPNQGLSSSAAADINISNISRLERGMTQSEVIKIMKQPYSDQVFFLDDATYDLWYYVTNGTVLAQSRMMPANLTPLAFKNGILVGWGRNYANYLNLRKIEVEKAKLEPEPQPTIEEHKELENKPLENLLTPQNPPKQQPQRAEPPLNLSPLEPTNNPEQPSKKKEGTAPNSSAPNWGPLEKQPTAPGATGATGASKQTSMSKRPETKEEPKKKPVPLDEEDEQMLQDERQQDFDQT